MEHVLNVTKQDDSHDMHGAAPLLLSLILSSPSSSSASSPVADCSPVVRLSWMTARVRF